MGVKSLWTLLAPVGRPIAMETMEGNAMAIDSSIWLYQFMATMRDKDGKALSNAHVLGFLRRICKLLFYGIKPVFVFDGGAPELKKATLNERRRKKDGAAANLNFQAKKLLAAQMKRIALENTLSKGKGKGKEPVLDENTVYLEDIDPTFATPRRKPKPPSTTTSSPKKSNLHDPYHLPDLDIQQRVANATRSIMPDPRLATEDELRSFIEEMRPEDFDVTSAAFRELPTEVQYEIVGDLRLKSRQTSFVRLQQMLKSARTPLDFSKQQIKNLQQRNSLTQQLLTTTDSIGKAHISIPVRIASERNREYVLVKNEGESGGWVLGIRDLGSIDKPIVIDHDAEYESEDDMEMEEVDIPNADAPLPSMDMDPDLRNYQRETVLSAIGKRYTPKGLAPLTTKPKTSVPSIPLFNLEDVEEAPEVGHKTDEVLDEDVDLAFAIQQSLDDTGSSQRVPTPPLVAGPSRHRETLECEIRDDPAPKTPRASPPLQEDVGDGFGLPFLLTVSPKRSHMSPPPPLAEQSSPRNVTSSLDEEAEFLTPLRHAPEPPPFVHATMIASDDIVVDEYLEDEEMEEVEPVLIPRQPISLPRTPSPELEVNKLPSDSVRSETPIEVDDPVVPEEPADIVWSRSPSPSGEPFIMPDLPPSPAGAWDAANEMDPVVEEGDFAQFISQVKGRDIEEVRREINDEIDTLREQRRAAQRDSDDVTQQMIAQIQTMLALFGIPYITAPMEAEAQCAELLTLGLVDGIITDDSDVFLFGGQRVFKNMFNQSKTVECFLLSDLTRELGLDRDTLVRLAYLLGSDYVDGLPGVGPVVGMELLKEFPGTNGLHKFKEWWSKVQVGKDQDDDNHSSFRKRFKRKAKDLYLSSEWPNAAVRDAYYHPVVDSSEEPFKWGLPDLDGLRSYLYAELAWDHPKVDELILPVIQKMRQRKTSSVQKQSNLNAFLDVSGGATQAPRPRQAYNSKRLQQVVSEFRRNQRRASSKPLSESEDDDEDNEPVVSAKRKRATAGKSKLKAASTNKRGRGGARRGRGRAKKTVESDGEDSDEDYEEVVAERDSPTTEASSSNVNLRPRPKPRPLKKKLTPIEDEAS